MRVRCPFDTIESHVPEHALSRSLLLADIYSYDQELTSSSHVTVERGRRGFRETQQRRACGVRGMMIGCIIYWSTCILAELY
jgi:hypothetical protein